MKKIIVLLVGILFCVTSLSYAQNINWNLTGAGARAAGFGGAFIGVADDATAISWNPAGLTQLIDPEFSAVVRIISDSYDYVWSGSTDNITIGHFTPNFASAVYPFDLGGRRIVAGIAYQQMLDFYSEWEGVNSSGKSTGGVYSISFGLGAEIFPIFSFGVTSNVWTGKYHFEDSSIGESDENFSGFNFNLGGMINLDNLNSPLPVKLGVGFKAPFELEGDYGSGTETVQMPPMVGVGGSVRLGDNLTLSCDYESRAYASSKIIVENTKDEYPLSDFDLNQLRAGAEYLVVTDFAVIPLRVGYHTVPTFYSNYEDEQVVGNGFAVGTGLIFERIAIDATVNFDSFKIEYDSSGENYDKLTSTVFTLSGIFYFNS